MKVTITIEDPDERTCEWLRGLTEARAARKPPVVTGRLPDPPGRPPAPDPDRPTDGRTLLGWADRHGLRSQVLRLGKSRGYPGRVVSWTAEQVADVYRELSARPAKGSQHWGGPARAGKIDPAGAQRKEPR